MKIDPNLTTFYGFGSLVIALHDGQLLALAVVASDKQLEARNEVRRTRNRRKGHKPPFAITWGSLL